MTTEGSPHVSRAHASLIGDGRMMVIVEPHNYNARFALADDAGITVLRSHNDSSPIGTTGAAHLTHVNAKPNETMRDIALRLHEKYGPAFHPDT